MRINPLMTDTIVGKRLDAVMYTHTNSSIPLRRDGSLGWESTQMRGRQQKKRRFMALLISEAALACALVAFLLLHLSSHMNATATQDQQTTAATAATQDTQEAAPTQDAKSGTQADQASSQESQANDDWNLVLVNKTHAFEGPAPELATVCGAQVDVRCAASLVQMFDDARAAGLAPAINSAYRSKEEQEAIMESTVAEKIDEGLSEDEARAYARSYVAVPGTSEHETGLAVDLTSEYHDGDEQDMAVHDWMAEHSWEYGWILRYPADKVDITGINNEPWHYRYVGTDAAREIYQSGVCLEEYLGD